MLSRFNLTEQTLPQTLHYSGSLTDLVNELSQTYSQDLQRLTIGLKLHAGKPSSAVKEFRTFMIVVVVLLSTDIHFKKDGDKISIDVNYQPTEQLTQSVMKIVASMADGVSAGENQSKPAKAKTNE